MHAELEQALAARLEWLTNEAIVQRVWGLDHTVWKPDPAEISNRLGWLDVAQDCAQEAADLEQFAARVVADGFESVLLLGMGGSSLGPEVLADLAGAAARMRLIVLDSTDPEQIRETEAQLDLTRTLVVVSSKSGSTIETAAQLSYFWEKLGNGSQFVAITDAGSALEKQGRELGFRRVFLNWPDVGGRYSVMSLFGMVPAALLGLNVTELCAQAEAMAAECRETADIRENPGAWLGAVLAEVALQGRDKCTLVAPTEFPLLGTWIEQLVAESTGKEGRGILPIEGESLGLPESYGDDRLFVSYEDSPRLLALEAAGHPVVSLQAEGIGAEFFRWEFATAIAGAILGVQPFDQPNVQEAKDAAGKALAGAIGSVEASGLGDVLTTVRPGDYIAINAFIARNAENEERLQRVRIALRDRFRVATAVGFGPRFLHSTGQIHKGGPATGVFIEVVNHERGGDIPVPGRDFTFGQLLDAQALGDLAALTGRGRRVCRVTLSELEELLRGE